MPPWAAASRGTAVHVLLALMLLLAQTKAGLHWLSHSTDAVQGAVRAAQAIALVATGVDAGVGLGLAMNAAEQRALPGNTGVSATAVDVDRTPRTDPSLDLSCDKCASLASLAAVLPADVFELALQAGREVQVAARAWSSAERILRLGYLSRAPPTAG